MERVDLPHDRGPAHVLHLMRHLAVAEDLAVVFERLCPVPLRRAARRARDPPDPRRPGRVPDDGSNVLPVRPGVVVVVDGNPKARRAMEAAGVEVHAYDGSEISLKGDGGPTCLTRPIWRRD